MADLKYFDVHTHVNFAAFDNDREATVRRALDAGVGFINVGTQKDTSQKAVKLAEQYDGVYAIVGIHPIHTEKSYHDVQELGEGNKEFTSRGEEFDITMYRQMAKHPKVVGIGECGLDYYRIKNHELGIKGEENLKKQEEIFKKHIELAIEVNKPLMLHVRSGGGKSAYLEALSILNSYFLPARRSLGVGGIHNSRPRANFHFFAGSWDEATAILDAGFYLSFTGVITFARNYDEVIKKVPLERIMSETDAPYVASLPHRGKRNEPAYVIETVKKIAEIRGEDFERVRAQLVQNTRNFFNLP